MVTKKELQALRKKYIKRIDDMLASVSKQGGCQQGGRKVGDWLKRTGRKVASALKSDKAKKLARSARNASFAPAWMKDGSAVGDALGRFGYGKKTGKRKKPAKKRPLTAYQKFVKEMRLRGVSMKEIGQLWRQHKGGY